MLIYYLGAICPHEFYKKIELEISQAAYRFNFLLAQGFQNIEKTQVICFVPKILSEKINSHKKVMIDKGIYFILKSSPKTKKRVLTHILSVLKQMKKKKYKHKKSIVICDALSITNTIIALLSSKILGYDNIGIVTDLPKFMGVSNKDFKKNIIQMFHTFLMCQFDNYVLLTAKMSDVVNKKGKPQVIVEGVCGDILSANRLESKYKKKVCLYAGSLNKEYGIDLLILAFIKANVKDSELHIYGNGNYEKEITKLCENYHNVFYFGKKPNWEIIKEERKATLLINPRPTRGEYNLYSFPSKTLEYMESGTPLLTTKLPMMPVEYFDHVYFFDQESLMGYTKTLYKILSLDKVELHKKGIEAQKFIVFQKNNKKQAEKILRELKLKNNKY